MADLTTPSLTKRADLDTYISAQTDDADKAKIEAAFTAVNARVNAQAAITPLTDNTGGTPADIIAAIPNPTDTPASADALRDDLVANVLPKIVSAIASLSAKIDALIAAAKG